MKCFFIIISLFTFSISHAQTNTFPTNGNVGIGTASPSSVLDPGTNLTINTNNSYSSLILQNNGVDRGFFTATASQAILGTVTANTTLQFNTNGLARVLIDPNGYVGIGTTNPGSPLTIKGSGTGISFSPGGSPYFGTLAFNRETQTGDIFDPTGYAFQINNGGTDTNLHFQIYGGGGNLITNNAFVIGSNGNIGIGISDSKGYKLAVAGNMITESIKVKLQSVWPDYVLTKSYQLPSLQETEKHIKEKGHLPGIPSAAEVKNNGIDLGEMNAKLLQKIEELTLYLIELNKKTIEQREENYQMRKQMNLLTKKIKELINES